MRRSAPLVDLLCVVIFVLIGRAHHDHGDSLRGVLSTSWPFVLGLALGWLGITIARRDGRALAGGAVIVLVTVTVGMIARVVAGQGTALSFIIVALAFNGAVMLAWRLIARRVAH